MARYSPAHSFQDTSSGNTVQLHASLKAYTETHQGFPVPFTSDEVIFVIDTGASVTVTNSKLDFILDLHPVQPTKLQGITSGLEVKGI